jgi:adenylate cyclase
MSTVVSAAMIIGASCLYLYAAVMQFKASGLWLPVMVPIFLQSPLAYFSALVVNYLRVSKERQNIRDAFGFYLPNDVVDRLMRNASTLHDGGQTLFSTCLFTDAARYTHVSETMDPGPLRDLMNAYYEAVFEPIKAKGGIVLQVIGDSVLSIWASARPDNQQKKQACEAALGIVESVSRFNAQAGENQLPTRIGLHAGLILLGNIGAMDHFEYRPVGDIVNTASRLEGLNKQVGTQVLVSEEVLDGVDGLLTRCIGRFVFIGKSNPNTVYELIGPKEHADDSLLKANRQFAEGLKAFSHQSWAAAADAFARVAEIIGPDGPSRFYTNLCTAYRRKPPDTDWDGTVNLTQK